MLPVPEPGDMLKRSLPYHRMMRMRSSNIAHVACFFDVSKYVHLDLTLLEVGHAMQETG